MAQTSIVDELIVVYNPGLESTNQTSMIVCSSRKTNRIVYLLRESIQTFYLENEPELGALIPTDRPAGWPEEEHSNQERPMMKVKVGFISANARRIRAK
jgi:hypothetical protein